MVSDPGDRQIGQNFIGLVEMIKFVAVQGRDDQVVEVEHHPFRPAGCAGRIENDRNVVALALGDLVLPPAVLAGIGGKRRAPAVLDRCKTVQARVIVIAQPTLLIVDNMLDGFDFVGDRQNLVDLFLIFHDRERHFGMFEHEGHFFSHGIRVDRDWQGADRLGDRECPVEPGLVRPDDRDPVAALDAQVREAESSHAHFLQYLRPGPGLPDSKVLFPHCGPRMPLLGISQKQFRKRISVRGVACRLGH